MAGRLTDQPAFLLRGSVESRNRQRLAAVTAATDLGGNLGAALTMQAHGAYNAIAMSNT